MPERFWDPEKKAPKADDFKSYLSSLEELKANTDRRLAGVPEKSELYKFELPQGVKLAEGIEIDAKDPEFVSFTTWAKKWDVPQEALTEALGIRAAAVNKKAAIFKQGIESRNAALGENGAARVEAVSKFIDATTRDASMAQQVKSMVVTPGIVEYLEKIQKQLTSQGIQSFNQIGRDGAEADDGKPSNWAAMSATDRRTWQLQQQEQQRKGKSAKAV